MIASSGAVIFLFREWESACAVRWSGPGAGSCLVSIIGVIGIVMIALAYPLYDRITKKNERRSRR